MLDYTLYKIGEFLATCFSWKIAYKIGIFFSNLQYLFSSKDREAVINNLRVILPNEKESVIKEKAREV
jgi:lauroyl/myristoyl acyltransferase